MLKSKYEHPELRAAAAKAIKRHATAKEPFVKSTVIAQRLGMSPTRTRMLLQSMMQDGYRYYGKPVYAIKGHGYALALRRVVK